MADYTDPTSELEAVNAMLVTIGETPVNTIEDTTVADAQIALDTLRRVSREVQKKGWTFNTEKNYPLPPTSPTPGEIKLPNNVLRVDAVIPQKDVVQRGFRLYDRENHTYLFDETLQAEMVVALLFDELPEAARQYIYLRSARVFQDLMLGSQTIHGFTQLEEQQAWAGLLEAEADVGDYNILTGTRDRYAIWGQHRGPLRLT